MSKKLLKALGTAIFTAGLVAGIYTSTQLTANPYVLGTALTDQWMNYLIGFGVSVAIMAIGGFIFLAGWIQD